MSWLSELPDAFALLKARFRLRETSLAQELLLRNSIQPVTILDELMADPRIAVRVAYDPGATGQTTVWTVPAGERWLISSYRFQRAAGVSLTTDGFILYNRTDEGPGQLYTATADRNEILPHPIMAGPGWLIRANIAAYTASDTLLGRLLYRRETI